jgi:hypothetical protein
MSATAGPSSAHRADAPPPGTASASPKLVRPTFALLREKRELRVRNPENGARFTISLRGWQAMLWAVRVHPEPQWRQPGNAYTTAHRILQRPRIENWLSELQLA